VSAKRNALILGCALIAALSTTARSGDYFTDQGSIWAGGVFSYLSESVRSENNPMNLVMLSPVVRFFPVQFLLVSPAFSWETMSSKSNDGSSSSSGSFSIGPQVGFAFGKNIPVVPYVISGVSYVHQYYSDSYSSLGTVSQTYTGGADGYAIPIFGGVMIPLVDGLGIQVETGFTYNHTRDYTTGDLSDISTFSISVGVCGVGKKLAVSFLNSFLNFF
jgi:hypothetical protein